MKFSRLILNDWRQYASIDIELHDRITIIAGANGAGKSTILKIFSHHFGYNSPLYFTLIINKDGSIVYVADHRSYYKQKTPVDISENALNEDDDDIVVSQSQREIGFLQYSNNQISKIQIGSSGSASQGFIISSPQEIAGLSINSHRPQSNYQSVQNIPTNPIGSSQAYQIYANEIHNRLQNSYSQHGPIYRMKEALISMSLFGPGNQFVQENREISQLLSSFKDVLRIMLPDSIGFLDIKIRIPDVIISTRTGDFMIDASSGGLLSIIDVAWQIFMYSKGKKEFSVVFDEPENHLHPSMQRSLVRKLVQAFPNAQFIFATHSPFIVSSVRDSFVYILDYRDSRSALPLSPSREVVSTKLDVTNRSGSASEILREVLGVPVTIPEWAEEEFQKILSEIKTSEIDVETIDYIKSRLDEAGVGDLFPEALQHLARKQVRGS